MTFIISYEIDYTRLIMGVNNDSTAIIPAIANQLGAVILAYNQAQIAQVVPGVNIYRLETLKGGIAGFFALQTLPGQVGVIFQQLRPAFVQFQSIITENITKFIMSGDYQFDVIQ